MDIKELTKKPKSCKHVHTKFLGNVELMMVGDDVLLWTKVAGEKQATKQFCA